MPFQLAHQARKDHYKTSFISLLDSSYQAIKSPQLFEGSSPATSMNWFSILKTTRLILFQDQEKPFAPSASCYLNVDNSSYKSTRIFLPLHQQVIVVTSHHSSGQQFQAMVPSSKKIIFPVVSSMVKSSSPLLHLICFLLSLLWTTYKARSHLLFVLP